MAEYEDNTRFWVIDDINVHDGNGPENWQTEGVLVGIVDEDKGGIIAYCHKDMANCLLTALRGTFAG